MALSSLGECETITAIATPFGNGGVGIIRISGTKALSIYGKLVQGGRGGERPATRIATVSKLKAGDVEDTAIVLYFPAPHSFTGEDVMELQLHGGAKLLQHFLDYIISLGARLAHAGEFTRRALMNGKMNLAAAESLSTLIHAESEAELTAASAQTNGELHAKMLEIERDLTTISAQIWAFIDHPEEVEAPNINKKITSFMKSLAQFTSNAKAANYIYNGINVAILGEPNAGKSSLFNQLLGHDRSIVTEIAGTTTDLVSETIEINGFKVRLVDTAGIRENPKDKIEKLGIERTKKAMEECDIALVFGDIKVPNKPIIYVKKGSNIAEIKAKIIEKTAKNTHFCAKSMANLRQINELKLCEVALKNALTAPDIAASASDIQTALFHISNITGTNANEAVLDEIFSKFCLGK